ncbi:MAG: hypothetical protein U0522_03345 [Candidatus Paceibacterota bacterium]
MKNLWIYFFTNQFESNIIESNILMKKTLPFFAFCILFFGLFLSFSNTAKADYQRASLGDTITIGEFVYDDDFVATTTAGCTLTIYDPSGSVKLNAGAMTANANGWTYYNFSIGAGESEGNWPTYMTCGNISNGDLVKVNKTFTVGATIAATSTIANAVWNSTTRTLSSFGSLVSDVWSNSVRTLTSGALTSGSLATLSDVQTATSSLASAITAGTSAVNSNTSSVVTTATSSLAAVINANTNSATANMVTDVNANTDAEIATASSSLFATIPAVIWSYSGRTLTSFGTLASDVWSNSVRTLTSGALTSGSLATLSDVQTATSSLAAVVNSNTDSRVATASSSLAAVINANTNSATANIVTDVNANTDAEIATASSSLFATLPATIWSYSGRTLTSFGTLVADVTSSVWSNSVRTLTSGALTSGSLATLSDVQTATSSLASAITAGTSAVNSNTSSVVTTATSSLAAVINANTNSATANIVTDVNANTDAEIATASSSLFATIPAVIWSYSGRTLTSFGTLASDVWSNSVRTLTSGALTSGSLATLSDVQTATSSLASAITAGTSAVNSNTNSSVLTASTSLASAISAIGGSSGWTTVMSDFNEVQAGETYRARIEIRNNNSVPTSPFATPTITLYDPLRNVTVSNVAMSSVGTGIYEYTYSVASGATQGVWESVISTQVESGKTLTNNDYWLVAGSPAQVIINSVTANSVSDISANVTITNEGLAGYEYQYEWCVVSSASNSCGGGDDEYHATGAKFINPGEDWNTNLTATVDSAGDYYFKLIVYFGTDSSGSSRTFTVSGGGSSGGGGGGGGSSGGGSSSSGNTGSCKGADFNSDNIVNSVDFSILLAFWKNIAPFQNECVDINQDSTVNSVDFSILLSQWGTSGSVI